MSGIEQIKQKKYYEKYLNPKSCIPNPTSQIPNPKIYLVGIVFSEEEKNIIKFGWERVFENIY